MNTLSSGVNASVAAEGNMKHSMGKEDLGFTLSGMRRDGWLRSQLAPIQLSLNFTGFSQVGSVQQAMARAGTRCQENWVCIGNRHMYFHGGWRVCI